MLPSTYNDYSLLYHETNHFVPYHLKNFDFFDSKGKLKEKMDELENSWKAIETDIKEGKKLLTTPLSDEDLDNEPASGEKIDMNLSQQEAYNKI